MDARELEAFAQFLQMNGMSSGQAAAKRTPSFWESFKGRASVSVGLFGASIIFMRQFGDALA